MQIKIHIPFISDTTKKLILNNVLITTLLLLILNFALVSILNYVLTENLDQRLKHEIENIKETISVTSSGIEIKSFQELNESDLTYVTEHPYFLQIYDLNGNVLLESKNLTLFSPIPQKVISTDDQYSFEFIIVKQEKMRVGYTFLKDEMNNKVAVLQLSIFAKDLEIMMGKVLQINLLIFPVMFFFVVISSYYIAKKSYKPLNQIIDEANKISTTDLSKRININSKSTDEMGRLRDTLNSLMERISSHIKELSNFTDQASHQLMNPLTALRSELDYLLKKDRTIEEYRATLSDLKTQTDHMINIVKTLLLITKGSQNKLQSTTVFNLSKLINNDIKSSFRYNKILYSVEDDIYIKGDNEKVFMALQNLITNAIKYSPQDEQIQLKLYRENSQIRLEIIDCGIGIPDSEKTKVFQRFYRSELVEKMGIKGYGLGLSLVKSVFDEIGAEIIISDNIPKGTIFTILIPYLIIED
ncbi:MULTISPECIES: HAMP domain-containing sensor histidine kinase [Ignavibacterium]|uniref:sensor histidine kinase n=1 Tax=Ignavibacterium TaxID=795750 RepID=UPI0025BB3F95|nr:MULTISPECIES: HAMP domain-containing sensor histidine kinase [Ignavibacterium]MBI5662802.1 HAMP domain-containing histidine kinase [Ignavibacterium album]